MKQFIVTYKTVKGQQATARVWARLQEAEGTLSPTGQQITAHQRKQSGC